jgi:hypothetical protein
MDCIENYAATNSSIVACICCQKNVFTETLPSKGSGDIHTDILTAGRDLWRVSLRWAQVPWYTYQVSWQLVQAFTIWWGRSQAARWCYNPYFNFFQTDCEGCRLKIRICRKRNKKTVTGLIWIKIRCQKVTCFFKLSPSTPHLTQYFQFLW